MKITSDKKLSSNGMREQMDELPPSPQPKRHLLVDRLSAPFIGMVFLVFMVAGLWSTVSSVLDGSLVLKPENLSWSSFLDGKLTGEVNENLGKTPLPEWAASLERRLSWLVAGDLGERVRVGCPDWLFLTDELRLYPQREQNAAARAQNVIEIHRALSRRGIELLVVVVPDKTRIQAAQLCGLGRSKLLDDRVQSWVERLIAAHVPVVNLEPVLQDLVAQGQDAFLRTDTHWNELGAQAAAAAVAQAALALKLPLSPHLELAITPNKAEPRPGDLVRLAGIDALPLHLQPKADVVAVSRFLPLEASESPAGADDLFGDAGLPNTVLIGTSFSRNSNFLSFLERELHTKIGDFSKDGGAFSGAAVAYFSSAAFKDTPPRLIVWEIPERVLEESWQNIEVSLGAE
ncbi:MAG: hypothetical protein AB7S56_08905 [Halothiobacillaceae bacterium]